jgi:hypothetical protein
LRKKVLIITYYWPPSGGAGVQRWLKTTKYLQEFGWDPIILTPENPDFDLKDQSLLKDVSPKLMVVKTPIWEPYGIYQKIAGGKKSAPANTGAPSKEGKKGLLAKVAVWARGNLFIPDPRKFWVKPTIKTACDLIKSHKIDYVISTGPPHSMHLIGLGIKKKLPQIKWLADFRDPWSTMDSINSYYLSNFAKSRHKDLEMEVCQNADRVVMVTDQMLDDLVLHIPQKTSVIENGFDHADFQNLDGPTNKKFIVSHYGTLYPFRNPSELWRALSELCKENSEFADLLEINLGGKVELEVKNEILSYPELKTRTIFHGYISHDHVVKKMAESNLLLLLINKNQGNEGKGYLTGKIYEYFAVQRPILVFDVKDGVASKAVKKAVDSHIVFYNSPSIIDELKKELLLAFTNRLNEVKSDKDFIFQFTRQAGAKKMSELLLSI